MPLRAPFLHTKTKNRRFFAFAMRDVARMEDNCYFCVMKTDISGMTALVTGGSSGIGLEYARQLAALGCRLVLVSNREDELAQAASNLKATAVTTVFMDLAQEGCAGRLLETCDNLGLTIDILVNNAGMFFMKYLDDEVLPRARAMMELHVKTVTELCILFGNRMKSRGRGYILNMSSMAARIPAPGIAIYSASKAYLKIFGKGFSSEMRPFGVYVTTVCPAAIDTGLYNISDRLRRIGRRIGLIRSKESLVRRALRALFRGRRTVSPGLTNVLLPPVIAILPSRLVDRLGMKWIYKPGASAD